MTHRFVLGTAIVLLFATPGLAQGVADPALRDQLHSMAEAAHQSGEEARQHAEHMRMDEMRLSLVRTDSIEAANARAFERTLRQSGWPGFDMVGEDGSAIAFDILIAAYRDDEDAFEPTLRLALPLMEAALANGDVDAEDFAFLFDTLRIADTGAQWYGTQIRCERESARDGTSLRAECEPWPIAEEEAVDDRRAGLGLSTMGEYLREMESRL